MRLSLTKFRSAFLFSLGLGASAACSGDGPTASGGTGGSRPDTLEACVNPRPFGVSASAGIAAPAPLPAVIECEGGWLHRARAETCGYFPSESQVSWPGGSTAECLRDTDCTAHPFGYCVNGSPTPAYASRCAYGCAEDSDCADGMICLCAAPAGQCVPATCKTDAECGQGLCAGVRSPHACSFAPGHKYAFACQHPDDECQTNADCENGLVCKGIPTRCAQGPVCGRPFLVDGAPRFAEPASDSGWTESCGPLSAELDAETRGALAAHWTSLGLMEHASIAAFARFSLELLALGAPAELVEATQRALGDEIAHAKLCFGMAGAYAGAAVGPSALTLDGALEQRSSLEIIRTAFLEACIGETLAAVEAATLAEHAVDPVVRRAFERVAADETRHAELGFKFIRWALDSAMPEFRCIVVDELSALLSAEQRLKGAIEHGATDLLEHGVASPELRKELRRACFAQVIAPCFQALIAPAAELPSAQARLGDAA